MQEHVCSDYTDIDNMLAKELNVSVVFTLTLALVSFLLTQEIHQTH